MEEAFMWRNLIAFALSIIFSNSLIYVFYRIVFVYKCSVLQNKNNIIYMYLNYLCASIL